MMSEADQIAYAIKMSLQGDETASEAETPNADSSRETTPMDTDLTRLVRLLIQRGFLSLSRICY